MSKEQLAAYIARLVDSAPPLGATQRETIRSVASRVRREVSK